MVNKLTRLVVLASALFKLYQKLMVQRPSPAIIRNRLAYPFSARVIRAAVRGCLSSTKMFMLLY